MTGNFHPFELTFLTESDIRDFSELDCFKQDHPKLAEVIEQRLEYTVSWHSLPCVFQVYHWKDVFLWNTISPAKRIVLEVVDSQRRGSY